MSEEILKALMQLFAIIAKQDEGVETNEKEYVKFFLNSQLNEEQSLVYYGLLSITDFLPRELDVWNLTSAAKMLRMTDSSFWNYLYSVSLLLVLNAISGVVLWKKLKGRYENG